MVSCRRPLKRSNGKKTSTADKLDTVLNTLCPVNSHVHLGPGTFETKGYADGESTGWQPKAGMKIEGSGIGVTTLKLVGTAQNKSYFAVGHALTTGSPAVPNLLDYFEICDLTVDCNLGSQTPSMVSCAAVRVMGNHCRIRRVQAINWGSKHEFTRCHVIFVVTADPASGVMDVVDAVIEECLVLQPATASIGASATMTLIHAGGLENSTNAEGFGRSPMIRNCFVDGGTLTLLLRGVSMSWCKGGIVEGNQIHNVRFGGPYQGNASTRDVVVRNNHYRNVHNGPWINLQSYAPSVGLPRWQSPAL